MDTEKVEVKIAKLEEKMDGIEKSLNRIEVGLSQLSANFSSYVTKEEMTFRDRELKDLKDNQTWLWRTALSALILSPLGSIVVAIVVFVVLKGGS